MDLRNLLGGGPGGATKQKNVTELRQGLYKKSGTKSSSENRTLRTIQANQKRTASRATKINAGRGIIDHENTNDENRNVNIGAATTGRLSRRDRLEQYRKDKKAAIERMLYPSDAERFTTLWIVWLPCPPFQTQKIVLREEIPP